MPELARFPLTPQAVANTGAPVPSAAVLDECIVQLKRLAAAQVQREDRERVQVQAWLQAEWGTKPGAVYWLKEEGFLPPVVFIARLDGTPTANVREMDELVRAAWGPINRKYVEGPKPCPEAFLAKYGHLLHRVPILAKRLGGLGAAAPGLTSVAPPVFESTVAGPSGMHARSRRGAGLGNTGGNQPPAVHRTSGQGPAVGPAAMLGGHARLVGVARAGAARIATPGLGGPGRGMPPGAGVAAVHRFGDTRTAPTSHLWGARGGGLQARLHSGHDGGKLGDRALAATSTTSRGDVDRGMGPEASNFGFSSLPLLCPPPPPPGDGGPSAMGQPAVANTAGRLAPAGAGRGSAVASTGPPISVAGVPARDGPVAGSIGQTRGGGSDGAAHVPPVWHVSGGAFGMHGSGSRSTSRRGRGPLSLCDRAQTPSRCAPGLPYGGQLGAGPHPPAPPAPLALRAGPPPGWPWEASFAMALLQWASRLRWLRG